METHEPADGGSHDCPEAAVLEAYARGERASASDARSLETHVAGCNACREFLDDLAGAAQVGSLIREARSDLPPETRDRLVHSTIVMLSRPGAEAEGGLP